MNIQINNRQSAIDNRQFDQGLFPHRGSHCHRAAGGWDAFYRGGVSREYSFYDGCHRAHHRPDSRRRGLRENKTLCGIQLILILLHNAEFAYPSTPTSDPNSKQYWWSAIFRSTDINDVNDVQVTVFVSRKVGMTYGNTICGVRMALSRIPKAGSCFCICFYQTRRYGG